MLSSYSPDSISEIIRQQSPDFDIFHQAPKDNEQLLKHACYFSQKFPEQHFLINLCEDRYLFCVVFLAGILSNRPNLLPPNQAKQTLHELQSRYPEGIIISDKLVHNSPDSHIINNNFSSEQLSMLPRPNPEQIVSISFTSGSTGKPKAIAKTWQEFQVGAQLATHHLGIDNSNLMLVSTVPMQHMYGLESGFFWPLFSKIKVHRRRPFFPEDIRKQIASASSPCLLVTTPKHLQSCVEAKLKWQNVERILSSTAPMSQQLAEQIEACFNAPLDEIYGSTETLSYASRRITKNQQWQPYQGIAFSQQGQNLIISGGHLNNPVMLDDQIKINNDGSFSVIGRSTDMVKIAGKRASLLQLNNILKNVPEVEDGVFFSIQRERLGVVVAGKINKKTLLNHLKQYLDPVFLPRTIHYVDLLPRNELGKLDRHQFEQLLEQLARDNNNN